MAEPILISLIHLIQHPEKYHKQEIQVIGFAAVEFEHLALYVSTEAYQHAITKNAVWIEVDRTNEAHKRLHKKFALVQGRFDMEHQGHLRMYSGCITDITRFEAWSNE